MKVGDLVIHGSSGDRGDRPIGVITHLWFSGGASVLFEDGEYDVDSDDLEVLDEG